jgi:hypothetical protein
MRALLRKDALWMSGLGLVGLVMGLIAMADLGGASIWYLPSIKFGEGALIFHWIASGLLGLFAVLFEDANRTREYLLHRPISPARLFWTRHLLGLAIVVSWIVVLPALHLVGTMVFHASGSLAEPGRLWGFINWGTVGLAFYAVPVFGVTVVRRTLLGIVVAFLLSLVLLGFLALSLQADPERIRTLMVWGLAPISLAFAVPMMVTAMRLEREGRDLDRPMSRARLTAVACGLVAVALAGSVLLHMNQLDARRNLESHYPQVALLKDGTPALVVVNNYKPQYLVDAQHRRIAGPVPELEMVLTRRNRNETPKPEALLGDGGRLMRGVRYDWVAAAYGISCYVGSDGLVHLFKPGSEDAPGEVRRLGKEGGQPFSRRSRAIGPGRHTVLILDREDHAIWRYDLGGHEAAFTRVTMPGGDRVVEDLTREVWREMEPNSFFGDLLVVRGERGVYLADRSGFVPVPPDILRVVERVDRRRKQPQVGVEMSGPVHGRATLPASDGRAAFTHDYTPRTLRERATYLLMTSLSLLRPPLLTLGAVPFRREQLDFGNPTDDDARIFLDPMVMNHAGWILPLCLLLGAGLAVLTYRRLGRLGLPPSRRALWTGTVFCFGVLAYVVHRACENDRAWRAPPKEEASAPLLIKSAA